MVFARDAHSLAVANTLQGSDTQQRGAQHQTEDSASVGSRFAAMPSIDGRRCEVAFVSALSPPFPLLIL